MVRLEHAPVVVDVEVDEESPLRIHDHGRQLEWRPMLEELVAPKVSLHGSTSDRTIDLAGAREILRNQRQGFADWKVTVHEQIAEGDLVVSSLTVTGTHTGRFRSVESTGKSVSFDGIFIDRVVDGKITEMWHKPDFLRLLIQICAVPESLG